MRLVAWLTELGKGDGALAGGKGANLGELLRASLPVPPGFVVTTAAYRHFVAANSLQPLIERLAEAAPAENLTALTDAATAIGALFAQATMPLEVATTIREAYSGEGGHVTEWSVAGPAPFLPPIRLASNPPKVNTDRCVLIDALLPWGPPCETLPPYPASTSAAS
jgi:hypothetical protein